MSRSRVRWTICALLFFATTINYVDRQVFSILAPDLQAAIGWSEVQYGYIVTAFQFAYAGGLLLVGRLMDRMGTRRGFSLIISVWSVAAMAHALAGSAFGFALARFSLGLGEAGNFPAAIKTIAEWFPKRERALATGIFNAGSNVGAILAPLAVPWIALELGWRAAFLVTGAAGFLWLAFWLAAYRPPASHPRVSPAELALIEADREEVAGAPPAWRLIVPLRQTWAFAVGKFLTDPIWWFYLFWLPKFLSAKFGLTLDRIGLPLVAIYLAADAGSIAGGWLSSALIQRGWSVNAARKTAMLVCAVSVAPVVLTAWISDLWTVVALVGLATAAHQGWSANLFTMTSDMFPRSAVGSVVGFGGTAGAIGGMLLSTFAGYLLEWTGSYMTLFVMAGAAYPVALLLIQILVPRSEPAEPAAAAAGRNVTK